MLVKEGVQLFLEYCELDRNLSQRTLKMYDHCLAFFDAWFQQQLPGATVKDITEDTVRTFRLYLSHTYKNPHKGSISRQTQNYFLIVLRSFLKYLLKQKIEVLAPNVIELGKQRDRTIEFLMPEELQRIFNAVDIKTEQGLRDRAIFEVLFSTGLRVSELTSLNREDINIDRGEFSVMGKGRKQRIVFLSDMAKEWLGKYLAKRSDPYSPLFIRYSGPKPEEILTPDKLRLSVRSVERLVDKYRKMAGVMKKVSPHSLRHSFATDLLYQGADLRSVQMLLGHKNVSTTQVYTHFADSKLREIHKKFHSGNRQ